MAEQRTSVSQSTSVKFLTIPIEKLLLGAYLNSVVRVLSQVPIYGSGRTGVGIAHLDEEELTAIDLHYRLFGTSLLPDEGEGDRAPENSHLVVVRSDAGERFGILCVKSPSMADVPTEKIRVLPPAYRQADTLGVCSHVAVIPKTQQTLFILDPNRLL